MRGSWTIRDSKKLAAFVFFIRTIYSQNKNTVKNTKQKKSDISKKY